MTKEEFKAKWLESLRSGQYEQGTGYLRSGDSFCCLGVAADIIDSTGWHGSHDVKLWRCGTELLPDDVWGELTGGTVNQEDLSSMNDWGLSFEVIADHIEQHLLIDIPLPVLDDDDDEDISHEEGDYL